MHPSIEEFDQPFDLIFSNAAFHWVPDHARLFKRLRCEQLAVQMPMNDDHPSHVTAHELARTPEFRRLLGRRWPIRRSTRRGFTRSATRASTCACRFTVTCFPGARM